MKLANHFADFLKETVDLNKTRIEQLESSVDALKRFIRASNWGATIREFSEQGSWAHKTIIRPVDGRPYDADLLVWVNPKEGWEAKDYINHLYNEFSNNDLYKEKVRRFSHCVTIEYTGDKKIDIAPVVVNRDGFARLEVCNRNSNSFERSEPKQYTDWLIERNAWSTGNSFRKVTRLLKYLRDIKTTFTCSSVLLTTMLGERIHFGDKLTDGFDDVPSALQTIVGRLDDFLQQNINKPIIRNPFLYAEIFSNGWTDDQYSNFREKLHQYREWIDDAINEEDRDESIGKWRRVFGDEFAKSVDLEEATSLAKAATNNLGGQALVEANAAQDFVSLVAG